MTGKDPDDIDKSLARLIPKPAPSGLRQRVITSVREAREKVVVMPGMRAVVAVCVVVLVAVLAGDALISEHESARFSALLDGRSSARTAEDESLFFAEILGITGDQDITAMKLRILASIRIRQDDERDRLEALKRLKGWLEHETPEDLY